MPGNLGWPCPYPGQHPGAPLPPSHSPGSPRICSPGSHGNMSLTKSLQGSFHLSQKFSHLPLPQQRRLNAGLLKGSLARGFLKLSYFTLKLLVCFAICCITYNKNILPLSPKYRNKMEAPGRHISFPLRLHDLYSPGSVPV